MSNVNNEKKVKRYFAAANSKRGFVSFFDDVFFNGEIERRYIIKGGPGTGKSSFMRRAALCAEGKGMDVEYYYCSSDTNSLDGIVIDKRIAMLDGTAPHSYDTALPGACDEIINLGDFWDSDALASSAEKLRALGAQKRKAYGNAYGYLRAAGAVSDTLVGVMSVCVKEEKLKAAVSRAFSKLDLKGKHNGVVRTRQIDAFGTLGYMHFDTLEAAASKRYYIGDYYGTADIFMRELADLAKASGANIYVSWDTVDTQKAKEIYFADTGDYFAINNSKNISSEHDARINMKRFVDLRKLAEIRYTYRSAKQVYDTLLSLSLASLRIAGEVHGEIEKIYVAAMDFDGLGAYCKRFCEKIK